MVEEARLVCCFVVIAVVLFFSMVVGIGVSRNGFSFKPTEFF